MTTALPRPEFDVLSDDGELHAFPGDRTAEMARELDEKVAQRTRELTAANEELRRTIDAIPYAITILGPDGSTLGANAFVLDYTGLSLSLIHI